MNWTHFRPLTAPLAIAAAGIVLIACDSPTEQACSAVVNQQASVRADSVVTTSGLIYRELTVGTGAQVQSTAECQVVRVGYIGRLVNGTEFDRTPAGQTFALAVGSHQVIPGFEQGLVGMKVGGKRQLIIPPSLGYGNREIRDNTGAVLIPANSTLVFDVELVSLGN